MAEDPLGQILNGIASQIAELREDRAPMAKAEIAVGLAALTFLIDKGMVTTEEAVQRIQLLHGALQPEREHLPSTAIIQTAVSLLRQNGPKEPDVKPRWTPKLVPDAGKK
jgi:hypothetical protein